MGGKNTKDLKLNKKILIVSSFAPPSPGGSPHFFGNLFSEINPDSYVIFTDKKNMRAGEVRRKLPCDYYFFNDTPPYGNKRLFHPESRFKFARVIAKIFLFLSAVIYGLQLIRKEKIEVLLGTADKGHALILTFVLSKFSRKPYVLYFLDLYRWNNFGETWNAFANFFEPILFQGASKIFLMGEGHRKLYRKKYGAKYSYNVILNCPLKNQYPVKQNLGELSPPYEILFTGSIYWAQERSIRNLIRAVSEIRDIDIHFSIYSTQALSVLKKEFYNNPKIIFKSANPEDMPKIQRNASILFLPLSWDTPSSEVIQMATPGKTAEYLACGRPILVHAPDYSFISHHARQRGFAHVVDKEDIELLKDGIRKILTNKDYARKLVKNAVETFKDYDIHKNALILKGAIDTICND